MSTDVCLPSILVIVSILAILRNGVSDSNPPNLRSLFRRNEHTSVDMNPSLKHLENKFYMITHKRSDSQNLSKHAHKNKARSRKMYVVLAFVLITSSSTAFGIAFSQNETALTLKEGNISMNYSCLGFPDTTYDDGWSKPDNYCVQDKTGKLLNRPHKQIKDIPLFKPRLFTKFNSHVCHEYLKTKKQNLTYPENENLFSSLWNVPNNRIHHTEIQLYPCSTLNTYLICRGAKTITRDEEMSYEVRRLQSFNGSRVKSSPIRLAESGFYATGNGDETQCYSCRKTYRNWLLMDKPDVIHRVISPDCPHLKRQNTSNIPIRSEPWEDTVTNVCGLMEVYPIHRRQTTTESLENNGMVGATATVRPASPSSTRGIHEQVTAALPSGLDISRAVYPHYMDKQSRLKSYQGWGWSHVQDPRILSEVGFYYAGYRDCVRCFYCGVGLRTWEKEDDPWVEHVSWRSSCDYVRCMKGEQFVIGALAGSETNPREVLPERTSEASTSQQNSRISDVITKAEEMGFTREACDRAIDELTRTHCLSRATGTNNIQLETLIEKLVLTHEQSITYQSFDVEESHYSLPAQVTPFGNSFERQEPVSTVSPEPRCDATEHPQKVLPVNVSGTPDSAISSLPGVQSWMAPVIQEYRQATNNVYPIVANRDKYEKSSVQEKSWKNKTATDQKSTPSLSPQECQLEEENQSLRDESTCKVCLDNPSCIVFLPCGHLVTCAECAPALRKCPVCRAVIRGTVRAYND